MCAEKINPDFSEGKSWNESQSLAYTFVESLCGNKKTATLAALLYELDPENDTTFGIVVNETYKPNEKISFSVFHENNEP
ncbi:MAG TPA: hypothetical protein VI819_02035 [Patescibacteria group bacterium]|nr:hypothetical protein [Patescibacteria group bacterium]